MKKEMKADLGLLSVTMVWGASFPIMSLALKHIPPYTFLFFRYTLAAVLLFILFYKRFKGINKKNLKEAILIGVALALGCIFQIVGLYNTTASNSGFITGTNVVLVPIILAMVYKKIPEKKTILGVILSLTGLFIMSVSKNMTINYGDFLTFIGAIFFAIQIILVDKYSNNMDVMATTAIQLFMVGLLSFIPSVWLEGFKYELNLLSILAVLFTSIFCTIYAFGMQNMMQRYTSPTHTAIIFLAEPVFSAIFSQFIGERLSIKTLIGSLLILLGMVIVNLKWTNIKFIRYKTSDE